MVWWRLDGISSFLPWGRLFYASKELLNHDSDPISPTYESHSSESTPQHSSCSLNVWEVCPVLVQLSSSGTFFVLWFKKFRDPPRDTCIGCLLYSGYTLRHFDLQCFDRRSLNAAAGTVPVGLTDIWETRVLWNSELTTWRAKTVIGLVYTQPPWREEVAPYCHFLLMCSRPIVRFTGLEIPHSRIKCQLYLESPDASDFLISSFTSIIPSTIRLYRWYKFYFGKRNIKM